jgi:integrase
LSKDWLDHRKGRRDRQHIKPATYRQDKVYLNEHILPALGDVPLEQLTHLAVKKFLRKLTERKLAFNTVANILSVLRVFIDDILAEEWAQIIGNPARHPSVAKELPRRPSRTRGVAHLTIEQVCVLLKHKKTPVERKVRYLVGVCAGLRDGEVSALRFSSIAPTPGAGPTLCIQEALALDTVGRGVGFLSPKSEFSVRRIPVHPLLAELLGWWKSTGWPRWVGRPATDKALIFPNPDGKPWRPRSAELLREDLKNAGLPVTHSATGKSFEFHTLRASFSTWLAEAGVDTDDRAALMGHAPRSVTDAFYTDRTMRRLRVAIDRLVIPLTLQAIIGKPGASRETSL